MVSYSLKTKHVSYISAIKESWIITFQPTALRAAQSAGYLIYSEADFEVFRPAGATRCTDGAGTEEAGRRGPKVPSSVLNFTPNVQRYWYRTPKLKILLIFDQNVEYKRPAGAYPLRDFHKICRISTSFQDALAVNVSLDLLKGLWSYAGFNLMGSGNSGGLVTPKFAVPPSG